MMLPGVLKGSRCFSVQGDNQVLKSSGCFVVRGANHQNLNRLMQILHCLQLNEAGAHEVQCNVQGPDI